MEFFVEEDSVAPAEALEAIETGASIYCMTAIGWINVDNDFTEFRNGLKYKVE